MRAVVQRVKNCTVTVNETNIGHIDSGLLVYLGVEREDEDSDLLYLSDKIVNLRIFEDSQDKMNLSVIDIHGSILVISQFTLCADTRKGRRPSYNGAANPEIGNYYYKKFIQNLKEKGIPTAEGLFGAKMHVTYTNVGPVTILLDSRKNF